MIGFAIRALWLNRVKSFDPSIVERLQRSRLERLVRHVGERSPFYAEKYRGIDPRRFRLEDLPPTNKAELMADFDRVVTDRDVKRADLERFVDDPKNEGTLFRGRYVASHTSGSQGQPMLMIQDRKIMDLMFGLQMTRGYSENVSIGKVIRKFTSPARLAIVTLKRGFYPSASAFEFIPPAARKFMKVLWLSQTDSDLLDRLHEFRPTALTGYAGVLEELALEAEAGRLKLAPELRQIVNNSEVLTDRAATRISRAFGLHVMNNYATGECMFLTNACPADVGAHVNADWSILEVVDDAYRAVEPGTPGSRVLITNLANHALPFLRYEVGDVVTMASTPCGCGSRLPRVEKIDGRTSDTFWVEDGGKYRQLISSVFKNTFDHSREVREWQAVQLERNRFLVRVEVLPGGSFDRQGADRNLARQLQIYRFLGLVRIDFEVVPKLTADPKTGKTKRIVSVIGAPSDLETRGIARGSARVEAEAGHAGYRPASVASRAGRPASS